jgi:hypothetical protein
MFSVAPPRVVPLTPDARAASDDHRRRDFVFVLISGAGKQRLSSVAKPATLMTTFAHTQIEKWQPDTRLARALGSARGRGESRSRKMGVVQPLYRIAEQNQQIEGAGTGTVGRRRKR